jgi:hypothetical protein
MSIYRTSGSQDSNDTISDPSDFSRGKRHGTYYVTVNDSWTGHNRVIGQNFDTRSQADKWADKHAHMPYKVWQVSSADDGPKRAAKRARREKL